MIHDWDTHYWLARTPDGWISADDHSSGEPIFQLANRIRIEPLTAASVRAILDADIPAGYTAFLRTDQHRRMDGALIRWGYVLAVERGAWADPGREAIGGFEFQREESPWIGLPLKDGFRAELCCWNGQVAFESSPNFSFAVTKKADCDLYNFFKVE